MPRHVAILDDWTRKETADGMQCTIRPYRTADRDAVDRVALAAFSQYAHAYADWPAFSARIARTSELASQAELLVADIDGEVLGAVLHVAPGKPRSAIFPDDWAVIRMLVVAPGQRGRGVGRQLVAACLRHALRDGAPAVGLHTSPMMATALRLYTTLGFTRDRDLDPIDGVAYGRYVLPAEALPAALEQLSNWPAAGS
ncbi:GNAT family N-acetyltransferase [uncultured Massilia sp.]|uniref:GNAT family N-acetyltransferase n=1 Tax=uncultured Massilia sp. TaxID=169973 RepID=UPI002589D9F6|nr:GNAT family N-acetyltransferase [uncultured Massilia sp.]